MKSSKLKEKDILVLKYILMHTKEKGYPPSVREICTQLNIKSTSTVFAVMKRLETEELIRKNPSKTRAIEILDKAYNFLSKEDDSFVNGEKIELHPALQQEFIPIPMLGSIAAGSPIFAEENIEEYIPLPASLVKGNECFMLKVRGDSMVNAGIMNNDMIIVDSSDRNPSKNKIVAALVDGDTATVKRFEKKDGKVILKPENESYSDLVYSEEEVQILGCVTAVYRLL